VNIAPPSWDEPERLLVEVVDPLVHEDLAGALSAWFYFWESQPEWALRLRLRTGGQRDESGFRAEVARLLDAAREEGRLAGWYEGNHGRRGERYEGEAGDYGGEVWELVVRDWTAGSELALALVKLESSNELSRTRDYHWQRRVHLFSNQLLRDEIASCLAQARGYLGNGDTSDPKTAELMHAIERYLA